MSGDLRTWLQAAAILTGQQRGQKPASVSAPASGSALYATRLSEAQAVLSRHQQDVAVAQDLDEDHLRLAIGTLAFEIAVTIHDLCTRLPLSEGPTFSVTETQVLELLGGLLAGWGLAPYCAKELLAPQAQVPSPACGTEEERLRTLEERLQGCLDCVMPQTDTLQPSTSNNTLPSPTEQLADLLLKPCLFGLYPALLELAFKSQLSWAQEKVYVFFQSIKLQVNIENLLQLMALASSAKAVWAVKNISTYLSSQLRQPNGIYTLFLCMVRSEDPDPNAQVLERIARLILAPPPDYPRAEHFAVIVPSLLSIVNSKQEIIPAGIIRGASYVLSRIVLARHRSALPYLLGAFFKQETLKAKQNDASPDVTLVSSRTIHDSVHILSTWLQNAPPSHQLADDVLRPHLALVLSLLSYLKGTEDPAAQKTSLFKADTSLLAPLNEILGTWLQRSDTSSIVASIQMASSSLHDEGARYRLPEGSFWTASSDGQPCLKVKSAPEETEQPFEGDSNVQIVSIHPETLIGLIDSAGTKDLKAALMLRWLGETELSNDIISQVSPAQSFFTMQLLSQAIEKWGPETLEKPEDALSFVAFALRERPQEHEDPTEGIGIEDLQLDPESARDLSAAALRSQLPALGLTYLSFVLQANRRLPAQCQRMLDVLGPRIKSLTSDQDPTVATMASDVQHLLDMRSTAEKVSNAPKVSDDPYAPSRDKFKEALEQLQDPILPIKASGVDILRKLIDTNPEQTDPALWLEITKVLVSAVGNDDSYLYQRAVQCLTDLCLLKPQTQGGAIARDLVRLYADKPETILLPRDLDRRLRFGEALSSLVKASGSAFALYADSLVPTLLSVIRNGQQPTIMRASSLTCLGDCVEASVLALLPYLDSDLLNICLEILRVESRFAARAETDMQEDTPLPVDVDKIFDEELERLRPDSVRQNRRPEETADPLTLDAKEQPSLRRAACFFVACLAEASQEQASVMDAVQRSDVITVMRYVAHTDPDMLVGHQASQVLQALGFEDKSHRARGNRTLL